MAETGNAKTPGAIQPSGGKAPKIALLVLFLAVFFIFFFYIGRKHDLPGMEKSQYGGVSPDGRTTSAIQDIRDRVAKESAAAIATEKKKMRRIRHAEFGEELVQPKPPFGYGTLEIYNKRNRDVIVYLADAYTGDVKRSVYVWGGGKYRHTMQQVGPGTYLLYYVTGIGWDNNLNTFSYPSGPIYIGQYHEFKEVHSRQGVEVTNARVEIDPPQNPDEDSPETAAVADNKPSQINIGEGDAAGLLREINKEREMLQRKQTESAGRKP